MIDVEVVETKSNNYFPLLLFLLLSFVVVFKKINLNFLNSFLNYKQTNVHIDNNNSVLFNLDNNELVISALNNNSILKNTKINISDKVILEKENIPNKVYSSFPFENYMKEKEYDQADNINLFVENVYRDNNYLLITPNWDSALNRITQISSIGDVLYSVYHSYIYIVSIILLLGLIGAIILTADNSQEVKVVTVKDNKMSYFFPLALPKILKKIKVYAIIKETYFLYFSKYNNKIYSSAKTKTTTMFTSISVVPFIIDYSKIHSEDILANLLYFIIANIIVGLLLLLINSYFSLSVKYLEKGGGFECGFTSFFQTRERFNIIFYRVSLLFLVFDLEIILAFPYTAIYQKSQNISKNNVLAFLYILIVGFIYELKEGALNIVKKAHNTELKLTQIKKELKKDV
jgi:NADH:ubiquinone oxidoreductase subunit 3 (subunit A)